MQLKKRTFLVLFIIFINYQGYAQLNSPSEDWFIGGHFGTTSLWGDITDNENHFLPGGPFQNGFYKDRKMMYGGSFGKNISPKYALRAQFLFGNIISHTIVEKLEMSSKIQDYTFSFAVDLIDQFDWASKSNWDLYLTVGVGFTRFRSQRNSLIPNDTINKPDYAPNDSLKYNNNKYSTTISFPFGLGVNYKIGNNWVINAESSIRYLNTDWLDAMVSSKRSFEGFGYLSVGVMYRFNMPKGGSVWARKSSHSFDSQKDNTGSTYRTKRRNGSVTSDPFGNRTNKKSSIKGNKKRKKKTFKTPKK